MEAMFYAAAFPKHVLSKLFHISHTYYVRDVGKAPKRI